MENKQEESTVQASAPADLSEGVIQNYPKTVTLALMLVLVRAVILCYWN
jgi:hypothetical protein